MTPRLGLIHHPRLASRRIGAVLGDLSVPRACDWISRIKLDGNALGNDLHANCVPCGALRSIQIMRAVAAGDARKAGVAERTAFKAGERADARADRIDDKLEGPVGDLVRVRLRGRRPPAFVAAPDARGLGLAARPPGRALRA